MKVMSCLEVKQTLTSLEVATMVEKKHCNLIRDIKRYQKELNELNLELTDFFIESNYIDAKNEKRPCYSVTKKGCEFIAHKLTGIKGTAFTVRYINRFHEMEQTLHRIQPQLVETSTKLGRKSSWMEQMEENFNILCEAYQFSRKSLYNHILVDVGKVYDIEEAKVIYAKEKGYEPWDMMDVVEYFPQLREEAEKTIVSHLAKIKRLEEV